MLTLDIELKKLSFRIFCYKVSTAAMRQSVSLFKVYSADHVLDYLCVAY